MLRPRGAARAARAQRGAVSVELGLCFPILLLLVLGGLHLGRALGTRHELADATDWATRTAAIAKTPGAGAIQPLVVSRIGSSSCASITVSSVVTGSAPYRRLEVESKCMLKAPVGGAIIGTMGLDQVSVRAAMPY